MILLAAALAAAAPAGSECPELVTAEAFVCRGVEASKSGSPEAAAQAFEQVAEMTAADDPQRDRALAAAGNMWLAAGQPGKAALALDKALAGTGLRAEQRGEALLDRARVAEAQNDLKTARARVEEAKATISEDPFLWYFSAALGIREGDAATAKSAIDRALSLAPDDPTVLFEAGHVAHFAGNEAAARAYWTRASTLGAEGRVGAAAREALRLLDQPAPVQKDAAAAK